MYLVPVAHHIPSTGAFPDTESWKLSFCRSVPTVWKWGGGLDSPTCRKAPPSWRTARVRRRGLGLQELRPFSHPHLGSGTQEHSVASLLEESLWGHPPKTKSLARRQQWGTGFSEHFLSVYHSSEVCDVRSLMDASIHRLDIMMYREPRDI